MDTLVLTDLRHRYNKIIRSVLCCIFYLRSAPHKGRTCDNRTTNTTSILSVVCNDVPTTRHPVNIRSKGEHKATTRLTSPCPQRYHTGLHAPYPQSPDISTHPTSHTNKSISHQLFQIQLHRETKKKRTLYKLPSAPTLHPSSRYPILLTIAAIPHADIRAARRPISFASARKNCRSASVVSSAKKCEKMPMIMSSSSVGSLCRVSNAEWRGQLQAEECRVDDR